jgi:predicted acyl esterase
VPLARPCPSPVRVACLLVVLIALSAVAPAGAAAFKARGGIDYAYVLGAGKGERLQLLNAQGRVVAAGHADRFGSKIFRGLHPGPGFRVKRGARLSRRFRVLRAGDNPPRSFYRRTELKQGLNYVKMRDGTELAMTVRLPAGKTLADGPFPTLIEYSGYQTAAPHDLLGQLTSGKPDPLAPAVSTVVGSLIAPLLDFAVVSVQMRGSGCSGGAFDLFDLPTAYDGYDAVETVAAQSWVKNGKPGMVGISFSGISQLFVAGTRPPHLAAIAPLSVTDDLYTATGYPGGIYNSGFANSWVAERMSDAQPAPAGGQPYAQALVRSGDKHCTANQRLRLQTQDALKLQEHTPYRTPSIFARRAPGPWLKKDRVPTFLVGQFQDEQTGGHFPESLHYLDHNPRVWISLQNGVHIDSLGPSTITRWVEFVKLYVAGEIPSIPKPVRDLSAVLYSALGSTLAAPMQQSRFAGTTDVAAAKATFERDPRVRVLMDSGASIYGRGSLGATWELGFSSWPPKQVRPTRMFLGEGGALGAKPAKATTVRYTSDPAARPSKTLTGNSDQAWEARPPYNWTPIASGKGVGFTTPPLAQDVVIAGPSSLDLRLKSSARDTDLQVTLTEVRPGGTETYVQNGWLRASHRKLDRARSTLLDPFPTHLKRDAAPLPRGRFTLIRVPIFPVAHAFRAKSRIRVTVEAPGGDRQSWAFASVDKGHTVNTIALGGSHASRLVLPVVAGATAQGTSLPAIGALRGEPTRAYTAASNGG